MTPADDPLAQAPTGAARLRALVRFASFAALLAVLAGGGLGLLGHLTDIAVIGRRQPEPLHDTLLIQTTVMISIIVANLIAAVSWREPASAVGLGGTRRVGALAIGAISGLVAMSGVIVALRFAGALSFGRVQLHGADLGAVALAYGALFAMDAIAEEGAARAFALTQLSRAISFWPAALTLSALFGLWHLIAANENATGAFAAAAFGLVAAYSFRLSGGLWFAIGLHGAWDFAETFLFGVANSGHTASDTLTHAALYGPVVLTGGPAGPEGGLLVFPALALAALVACVTLRR